MGSSNSTIPQFGFSLIEVMVATLILMILVLMTGAVFRAGASAWDTGYAKAEGGAIVRTVAGAIQRELSKAVDARYFGTVWQKNKDGGYDEIRYGSAWDYNGIDGKPVPIHVDENEIEFIYYKDNLSKIASAMKPIPVQVKYQVIAGELRRRERELYIDPVIWEVRDGEWRKGEWKAYPWKDWTTVLKFGDELNSNTAGLTMVTFKANTSGNTSKEFEDWNFPWRIISVTARVEIYRSMRMSTITVRSYGPDGQSGDVKTEKDDIVLSW